MTAASIAAEVEGVGVGGVSLSVFRLGLGDMAPKMITIIFAAEVGGNQERSTKTRVSCLQSSMVVRVSWFGAK